MTDGQTAELNKLTSAWAMATALHPDIADIALRCSQLVPHLSQWNGVVTLRGKTESGGQVLVSLRRGRLNIGWTEKDRFASFEITLPIADAKPAEVQA